MRKVTVDGNEACSNTAYMFTELAGIYPITPSSPMAEHIDIWSHERNNLFNDKVKVIEMQSEAGAAGLIHGALQSGVLATTYTASQGLLLMIPNMYKIAGEMLPCVMHVAARSLSTHALSIFGDHQDIYATRMTGFSLLASSSVQDTAYLSAVAHLSAIKSSMPFLHFFDGFRTSHEIQKVNILEENDIKSLVDFDAVKKFKERALNPLKPFTLGTNQNDDIYFQVTEARNKYYEIIPDIVNYYMNEINKITHSNYKPFNYYGDKEATKVIVAMGSVCETIKEVVDEIKGIGLIEVHLYRPFSSKYLIDVLPKTVKKIAVLDRTKEAGSIGEPLYLDICAALKELDIDIYGGRYGLSSKNTNAKDIKGVFDFLDNPHTNFTVGITDDVTNLSIKKGEFNSKTGTEILIYGYGSDGMVSASKSLIKMVGDNTDKYVQGYFQYDSKKSGGVTICHLRIDDKPIRKTYYVENPDIVVLTKDTYLDKYDILNNIKENGIFVLNTDSVFELNDNVKKIISDKKLKFYTIDAYNLVNKYGFDKINDVIKMIIIYLTNVIPYELGMEKNNEYIKNNYTKYGNDYVDCNLKAMNDITNYLKEIKIEGNFNKKDTISNDIYDKIGKRLGDDLKVSEVWNIKDGKVKADTSKFEKRRISDEVPKWIKEKCIGCNQCSFVCPHAVIRPYELDEKELSNFPYKDKLKNNYIVSISVEDCTGCGLCLKTCPKEALEKAKLETEISNQEVFNYLSTNIKSKVKEVNNIKNSQFKAPKFMFHGACAGCGETGYIKLLTQMFGDSLIIANATGCSSIYGACIPSMPYSVPWASSLFEDNAEYGYGMVIADKIMKNRIKNILESSEDPLAQKWLNNQNSYLETKDVYENIDYNKFPQLKDLKDFIIKRNIWLIGGDGWAYDIGFGGIDHILASSENAKILVLDTEVYSNTGGQASKSTTRGATALFASSGKTTKKKDLARIALNYNAYVATVSLGANGMQLIKALNEANSFDGPAIVIAYAPCIAHGIKDGLINTTNMQKMAVESGYFPLIRRDPNKEFILDSKANFDLYDEFLKKQSRFNNIDLLEQNKLDAIERYKYFESLTKKGD